MSARGSRRDFAGQFRNLFQRCPLEKEVGTVEKGRFADLVAVSGDPLTDITETERIKFGMRGGVVFRNDLK